MGCRRSKSLSSGCYMNFNMGLGLLVLRGFSCSEVAS